MTGVSRRITPCAAVGPSLGELTHLAHPVIRTASADLFFFVRSAALAVRDAAPLISVAIAGFLFLARTAIAASTELLVCTSDALLV